MTENLLHVTDASFENDVLQSEVPALVDFWAAWCGPCKMIAPILEEIASEQGEKIQIAKLNVDEANEIATRFEVMSIPTLIVFDNGVPTKRIVGAKGKAALLEDLEEYL